MPNFTPEQIQQDPILKYFEYDHLPGNLQEVSALFCELATRIVNGGVNRNAERTAGLRKLLEAKDCIVRASLS